MNSEDSYCSTRSENAQHGYQHGNVSDESLHDGDIDNSNNHNSLSDQSTLNLCNTRDYFHNNHLLDGTSNTHSVISSDGCYDNNSSASNLGSSDTLQLEVPKLCDLQNNISSHLQRNGTEKEKKMSCKNTDTDINKVTNSSISSTKKFKSDINKIRRIEGLDKIITTEILIYTCSHAAK